MKLAIAVSLLIMACPPEGFSAGSLSKRLPQSADGWKAARSQTYDRDSIFRYMDGAGELYRSYGFRELLVQWYAGEGHPDIVVELYDMGSSADAFGVFAHDREADDAGVGQGSEAGEGSFRFWKDRFYVYLYVDGEDAGASRTLQALARSIAKNITSTGPEPALLALLPREGLKRNSVRFFHNHACLNYYFYLGGNPLDLDATTDGVLAAYERAGSSAHLLIVQYPNAERCAGALRNLLDEFLQAAGPSQAVRMENGKWSIADTRREFLVAVLDAASREQARKLFESAVRELGPQEE